MRVTKYLLDTCTVSYFLKEENRVIAHLKQILPEQIYISALTVLEIEYGLTIAGKRLKSLSLKWQEFKELINILGFGNDTALIAAEIKGILKKQGQMIGAYDILIAATALEHNLVCVTSNTAEFLRIKALKVEDWRS